MTEANHPILSAIFGSAKTDADINRLYSTLHNICCCMKAKDMLSTSKPGTRPYRHWDLLKAEPGLHQALFFPFYGLLQEILLPNRPWCRAHSLYKKILDQIQEDLLVDNFFDQSSIKESIRSALSSLNRVISVQQLIEGTPPGSLSREETIAIQKAAAPLSFYYALFILQKNLIGGRQHPQYSQILKMIQPTSMPDFLADLLVHLTKDPSKKHTVLLDRIQNNPSVLEIVTSCSISLKQNTWCQEYYLQSLLESNNKEIESLRFTLNLLLSYQESKQYLEKEGVLYSFFRKDCHNPFVFFFHKIIHSDPSSSETQNAPISPELLSWISNLDNIQPLFSPKAQIGALYTLWHEPRSGWPAWQWKMFIRDPANRAFLAHLHFFASGPNWWSIHGAKIIESALRDPQSGIAHPLSQIIFFLRDIPGGASWLSDEKNFLTLLRCSPTQWDHMLKSRIAIFSSTNSEPESLDFFLNIIRIADSETLSTTILPLPTQDSIYSTPSPDRSPPTTPTLSSNPLCSELPIIEKPMHTPFQPKGSDSPQTATPKSPVYKAPWLQIGLMLACVFSTFVMQYLYPTYSLMIWMGSLPITLVLGLILFRRGPAQNAVPLKADPHPAQALAEPTLTQQSFLPSVVPRAASSAAPSINAPYTRAML